MKVKVGSKIYDSVDQPLMVILNEGEKKQIGEMPQGINRYCQFPETYNVEQIKEWMENGEKSEGKKIRFGIMEQCERKS